MTWTGERKERAWGYGNAIRGHCGSAAVLHAERPQRAREPNARAAAAPEQIQRQIAAQHVLY